MLLINRRNTVLATVLLCAAGTAAALPVIPGAAGWGMDTPAGRGGTVYRVTNLADSGPGSLRACVYASGPRVCVFEVSGIITLSDWLYIMNPYLTIAGQTAPSPGIMIRGAGVWIQASDILVQHLAMRVGDAPGGQAFDTRDSLRITPITSLRNVVIDHCSVSWATDENAELWNPADNVTIRNSIFSEPLAQSPDGYVGGYNFITDFRSGKVSFIGNLFTHSRYRNPLARATDFVFLNNVVYNFSGHGTTFENESGLNTRNSVVGNVYRNGPDSGSPSVVHLDNQWAPVHLGSVLFVQDNVAYNGLPGSTNPWSIVRNDTSLTQNQLQVLSAPSWPTGLTAMTTTNDNVLNYVLRNAGSRPADRNTTDARIVAEVKNGTGRIINCVASDGSSRCSLNAGGWPTYAQNTRALTLPANPNSDDDGDGYTNLEEWLHGYAAAVETVSGEPRPMPPVVTVQ